MSIRGDGSVIIGNGVIAPTGFKFAVDGKAIMEEVVVLNTEYWPDYVFEKDYQLETLVEAENFIADNGHLSGIPSASEVKENGISLGQMNSALLKKIEELTLHMINMNKEIQELKKSR
jgi:hypothetical protein